MYIFPPERQVSCQLLLPEVCILKGFPHLSPQGLQKTLAALPVSLLNAGWCPWLWHFPSGSTWVICRSPWFLCWWTILLTKGIYSSLISSFLFPLFLYSNYQVTMMEDVTLESALLTIKFEDDQLFISPSSWYWNCFYFIYLFLVVKFSFSLIFILYWSIID